MPTRRKTDLSMRSRNCVRMRLRRLKQKAKEDNEIQISEARLDNLSSEGTITQSENHAVLGKSETQQCILDKFEQPEVSTSSDQKRKSSLRETRSLALWKGQREVRPLEKPEQREKRLAAVRTPLREGQREVRPVETPEQREKRLAAVQTPLGEGQREVRPLEKPEQREKRLAAVRTPLGEGQREVRPLEKPEQREKRLAAVRTPLREGQREVRPVETPEQREKRLAAVQTPLGEGQREVRPLEKPEQREKRLAAVRTPLGEGQREVRPLEKPEQREKRLAAVRTPLGEGQREVRPLEKPEQREKRLAAVRTPLGEGQREVRPLEKPEQREKRLAAIRTPLREGQREVRPVETPEQREKRLAAVQTPLRDGQREVRPVETPEQREKHLAAVWTCAAHRRCTEQRKRIRNTQHQALKAPERTEKRLKTKQIGVRSRQLQAWSVMSSRERLERERKARASALIRQFQLEKKIIREAQSRSLETQEQRNIRLERERILATQLCASKTEEQRELSSEIDRTHAAKVRTLETQHEHRIRLESGRYHTEQRYTSETQKQRRSERYQRGILATREREARKRATNRREHQRQMLFRQCPPALSSATVGTELSLDNTLRGVDPLLEVRAAEKPNILAVVATATFATGSTMETEEVKPDFTIKNEIDIEEEKLIRVNTAPPPSLKMEIQQQEDDLNTSTDPVNVNLYENIQIEIKQEETDIREDNYLIERNDITDKPTVIREATPYNAQTNLDVKIKEEQDESIVSYDYPNFDDVCSMDSCEAEALGNVETSLQDVDVKTENGGHQDSQIEDFHRNDVKIESDIIPEPNSSNQITPDMPETGPKYSFVMKIPGDVLSNIDQIVTSCLVNGTDDKAESLQADETTDNALDVKMNNESLNDTTEQTSLLQETDQSELYDLNPFQLNSITGNVLSLEQEAYNMLKPKKNINCPKCPKAYTTKYTLKPHLKVHQTIENFENGRLRGIETKRRNRIKRMQLLKQEIDEHDSQHSCSLHQEVKVENKDGYKCTCGKTFQRRTRMESCLRSHDFSKSEKYYCMTCLKDFKSKDELALHRKRLHRKKFPCKFCPTDYATRKKLFRHLQIHQKVHQMEYKVIEEVVKSKKKLRCFLCSKCCEDISELKIHVMSEHKGPYSCPRCKNTFPKIIDFGNHTKTYHPEVGGQSVLDVLEAFSRLTKEWKCEECDLQFLEADKLALHQVEQHSPELKSDHQFQCLDCRRVFISQKGLTSHRRIHHSAETSEQAKDEVPGIMCLECRKMCKDMSALTSHMRFHSPDRKYPCKFCDFRFATPEKRKTHADIHTGEMKFVCFICEYQCSSENRLKKHKQSLKHANMSEYLLTGKPLIEESSSKDKEKKDGSAKKRKKSKDDSKTDNECNSNIEEVSCDVCGENFPTESQMLEHKETHPFIEIPSADKPTRIFFK